MQTGHPAPAERVRGRIAVEQVPVEEIRANAPGQFQREDPDRGEPHPRVIVQIAGFDQFPRPGIETVQPGLPALGPVDRAAQAAILLQRREIALQTLAIARPDGGAAFQPALEVAAPDDLLHELLRRLGPVRGKRGGDHVALQHEAPPDIGRQGRDIPMRARPAVVVAPRGIAATHARNEIAHQRLAPCARRPLIALGLQDIFH